MIVATTTSAHGSQRRHEGESDFAAA
jgi:hypothetical protein